MWRSKDNRILIILCLLLAGVTCRAQYHPQYSQYMFNGLALNPAYAGSQEALSVAVLYRASQWVNSMEGTPTTQTFSGDFSLRNPQLSFGLLIFNDKIGPLGQTGTYFAYAYRVKAGEGKLSFGLQAGFDLHHENHSKLILIHDDDPLFAKKIQNSFMPNAGAGAYYYTSKFFAGLSLPKILTYSWNKGNTPKGKPNLSNVMLYGGMVYRAGKDFNIKPSTLLQNAGNVFLVDLNCNFSMLQEKFELGVSWRSRSTLVAMAQFRFNMICLGYAYDCPIGKPNAINTSHEIMLRYDFKVKVKTVSPLYL